MFHPWFDNAPLRTRSRCCALAAKAMGKCGFCALGGKTVMSIPATMPAKQSFTKDRHGFRHGNYTSAAGFCCCTHDLGLQYSSYCQKIDTRKKTQLANHGAAPGSHPYLELPARKCELIILSATSISSEEHQ
jgi:hypothetical protein